VPPPPKNPNRLATHGSLEDIYPNYSTDIHSLNDIKYLPTIKCTLDKVSLCLPKIVDLNSDGLLAVSK
jgi:hypothetical protein